eukprot:TRINITY_DN37785_c0_g1_i1.p1 TRINITY_DN37785_c0_g1~~TRINITY_DN37785_c0_g1_i1.p1  ORF type:complete len:835 (+),score=166.12 TRINITY_DN37785_c0_g1_i1:36-2540(+)
MANKLREQLDPLREKAAEAWGNFNVAVHKNAPIVEDLLESADGFRQKAGFNLYSTLLRDRTFQSAQGPIFTLVVVFPAGEPTAMESQRFLDHGKAELPDSILKDDHAGHPPTQKLLQAASLTEARKAAVEYLLYLTSKQLTHDDEFDMEGRDVKEREKSDPSNAFKKMLFTSADGEDLFFCLRMEKRMALKVAWRHQYRFQFSRLAIERMNIKLPEDSDDNFAWPSYNPFFLKKLRKDRDDFEESCEAFLKSHKEGNEVTPLRQADRVRLLYDLITDNVALECWCRAGICTKVIPSHSMQALSHLNKRWANFRYILEWRQPVDEIRDYFGEQIGFYFSFSEHSLVFSIGFFGVAVMLSIVQLCRGMWWTNHTQTLYAAFISIWSTVFIESWIEKQMVLANKWGMDVAVDRSAVTKELNCHFRGKKAPFKGDLNKTILVPVNTKLKMWGFFISTSLTVLYSVVVLFLVYFNLKYHAHLVSVKRTTAAFMANVVLSIQIKVSDVIWGIWSEKLTRLENWKYEVDHAKSRSAKLAIVRLANTFAGFFYIAFLQQFMFESSSEKGNEGCIASLAQSVFVVYMSSIVFAVVEIIFPLLKVANDLRLEGNAIKEKTGESIPPKIGLLEIQAKFPLYRSTELSDDYLQILFPLFFVMFFGITFPLTTCLVPLIILIQLRVDAWKLVHCYARPYPTMAHGIGKWRLQLIEAIANISVVSNWGLVVFQLDLDLFRNRQSSEKLVWFFAGQQIILLIKKMIKQHMHKVPRYVQDKRIQQVVQEQRFFDEEAKKTTLELGETQEEAVSSLEGGVGAFEVCLGSEPLTKYGGLTDASPYFEESFFS